MTSDLEKFLQQAAERLAQKANAAGRSSGGAQRPAAAPTTPPPRREPPNAPRAGGGAAGRFPPTAEIIEAEVLDVEEKRGRILRQGGSDPLSTIDTRPSLAQGISQADERMGSHVQHLFDHELTHLRAASPSLSSSQANQSDRPTEVSSRAMYKSPLLEMLRNPETLRAAFIVGEIFNRRP
jgi:hypothetical protein